MRVSRPAPRSPRNTFNDSQHLATRPFADQLHPTPIHTHTQTSTPLAPSRSLPRSRVINSLSPLSHFFFFTHPHALISQCITLGQLCSRKQTEGVFLFLFAFSRHQQQQSRDKKRGRHTYTHTLTCTCTFLVKNSLDEGVAS